LLRLTSGYRVAVPQQGAGLVAAVPDG
jgi:hypothetical protein